MKEELEIKFCQFIHEGEGINPQATTIHSQRVKRLEHATNASQ